MKILITGSSGFIGRQVVPMLEGHEVIASCDVFDFEKVEALVKEKRPDALLHLAWITTPGVYLTSEENLKWVEASLHLVRTFLDAGGKRVVVAGSCAEIDGSTLYGRAKRDLYEKLQSFVKDLAWGRLFYLYGPHEKKERFIPSIIQGILQGKEIPLSVGTQVRDFLHVKDAAKAFVSLLHSPLQGCFDIASGKEITIRELAEKVGKKMGGDHLLKFGERALSPFDPPRVVGEPSLKLEWRPSLSLDEGLEETIAWWKT